MTRLRRNLIVQKLCACTDGQQLRNFIGQVKDLVDGLSKITSSYLIDVFVQLKSVFDMFMRLNRKWHIVLRIAV